MSAAREPFWDNAKFLTIALVVYGHALEPIVDPDPFLHAAYRALYLALTPALVLVSGVFARERIDAAYGRQLLILLVLPYLAFETLYALAFNAWSDTPTPLAIGYSVPSWLLWYLMCLLWWRLMLPLFAGLRFGLAWAVTLAVAAGYAGDIGLEFSASRALVYFPFFLLGYRLGKAFPAWLDAHPRWPWMAGATLLLIALVGWCLRGTPPQWIYGNQPYAALGRPEWWAGGLRLCGLLLGALGGLALLAFTPRRAVWFSAAGERAINIYILHGLAVKGLVAVGAYVLLLDTIGEARWLGALLLLPLSLALAVLLGLRLTDRSVGWLTRPHWVGRWLPPRLV